jgi:hypothetical protein
MKDKEDEALNHLKKLFSEAGIRPKDFWLDLLRKPEMWLVLLSNALVFLLPDFNLDDAITLIWIYLLQSMLLGLVHFFKLLFYRFAPDDPSTSPSRGGQRFTAFFFLIHYGFFHVVYIVFVGTSGIKMELLAMAGLIYLLGQMLALVREVPQENNGRRKAGEFMFRPYPRIIPIHIAIILGALIGSAGIWIVLIGLKVILELIIVWLQLRLPAAAIGKLLQSSDRNKQRD